MSELTAEQKRRIEENRLKALQRLQQKKASPVKQPVVHSNIRPLATNSNQFLKPQNPPISKPIERPSTVKVHDVVTAKNETVNSFLMRQNQAAKPKIQKVEGKVSLISPRRFEVDVGFNQDIINLMKQMPSKSYDPTSKKWNFDLSDYQEFLRMATKCEGVIINPLPQYVVNLISKRNGPSMSEDEEIDLSTLGDNLLNSLMPFQREGILFGIRHNGRVLIADDMGLGKTIQAISLAAFYVSEWPLLIVVPSSVKYVWREQLCRWLPRLTEHDVLVVATGAEPIYSGFKVLIISYEMLIRRKDEIANLRFKVSILDECHLIKSSTAARTKAVLQVLKPAKRVVLLSGTPALSRPAELFTQLQAVRPDLFSAFKPFGERYCSPKQTRWGVDYTGSSNMQELQIVMEHVAMIRRIKKDVLDQLPSKMRQVVILDSTAIKSSKDFHQAAEVCSQAKETDNVIYHFTLYFIIGIHFYCRKGHSEQLYSSFSMKQRK